MTELVLNAGGVFGVLLMLTAYAGIHFDRLNPKRVAALLMNLTGSSLVLLSMLHAFNLSAFLMEAAWAVIAVFGLMRLAVRKR